MTLYIGLNSNGGCATGVAQDFDLNGNPVRIATNAGEPGPDVIGHREYMDARIGKAEGVPAAFSKHAKAITASWPDFLKAAREKGVNTSKDALPQLWATFVPLISAELDQRDAKAVTDALEVAQKLAKSATAPNARAIAADGLDAAQRKLCKQLGITAEAFLASPGERR